MGRELTVPDIEKEFGIKATTLYYWIENGLPARKSGRDYLINTDELQKFMDERVTKDIVYRLKPLVDH